MSGHSGKIPIGISSCLLGAEVRYDGGHKQDAYIIGTLGRHFEFVPICPEMAIGLGVPREPIRLMADGDGALRAVGVRNPALDVTGRLEALGRETAVRLASASAAHTGVCGYIFKSKSPSCGMARVKVFGYGATPRRDGRGVHARVLMDVLPSLPMEEEGRLGDPALRENFVERVFVYRRWQALTAAGLTAAGLVDFHSRHRLLVMAHSQAAYRRLGRRVAQMGTLPLESLAVEYFADLMESLQRKATRQSHTNVLQHLMGYLKKALDAGDKAELLECLDAYRLGRVPLIVPITLLKHHFRRHPHANVARQYYLEPHPGELMLRNGL